MSGEGDQPHRPEEADPPLGQARHPALCAQDRRTASTCIFGATCPKEGKGVALVMPWRNTGAMAQHLAATSREVEPGRHVALLLGRAGWRMSAHLVAPEPRKSRCDFADVTIVPLPPKCIELNPQGNVWQLMREKWLSNRVFTSYDNLVDPCCAAWNKLVDQPWTTMSIGLRNRAHAS